MYKKALTLTFVGLAALATAYPTADKVDSLEQMPDLSFGMYSGYVAIPNTQKKLHYVATLSQNDPATDPIILWFNGGPGCSSMLGFS
jgi:carboxypeptidase C (cathepsin A)